MMNQLKMIKLVIMRLRNVPWSREKLVLDFGQPKATHIWGQPLTNKILWSALSNYALGSTLINIGSLVSL